MKRNYKIGLVMKSLQADFFKVMKEGAIQYAALFRFWIWFVWERLHRQR